jgi:hypothetical protein
MAITDHHGESKKVSREKRTERRNEKVGRRKKEVGGDSRKKLINVIIRKVPVCPAQ